MKLRAFSILCAAVMTVAVSGSLSGCTACTAVGHLYNGPVVLEFVEPLADDAIVAACVGADCEPATVTRSADGSWEMPQEPPYLGPSSIGDGSDRDVRVVVTTTDGVLVGDDSFEIPTTSERTGWFGQCPGPFSFEPVSVAFGT